jgi:hypothetical protein
MGAVAAELQAIGTGRTSSTCSTRWARVVHGLGIALTRPELSVVVFDGDGRSS